LRSLAPLGSGTKGARLLAQLRRARILSSEMRMRRRGLLITFEGGDGTGKSTQIALLALALRKKSRRVFITREPGGTALGEQVRKILLSGSAIHPRSELLLFEASRAELVESVLRPKLQKGNVVLCDRFEDSSLAYQGLVRGLGLALAKSANHLATGGLKSDFIVLLDTQRSETSRRRLKKRGKMDRFESERASFHRRVRQAYLKLAKTDRRFHIYPAELSKDEIHARIWRDIQRLL